MISPISARPRPTRAAHSVASPVPAPCDCISMGPPFPRSVSHTLADREPPATARETLPEAIADRSEEHTSELQSHSDLVCRLLLEKKKTNKNIQPTRTGHQQHRK